MNERMKKSIHKILQNEMVSYVFWGATTTAVSIAVYTLLGYAVDYKIANFASIIIGKVYAYFVNKLFVFKSACGSLQELLKEIAAYILSRGFTGAVDFFGVIILVEGFSIGQNLAKYAVMAVVIALNYFLGKKAVFVKRKGKDDRI